MEYRNTLHMLIETFHLYAADARNYGGGSGNGHGDGGIFHNARTRAPLSTFSNAEQCPIIAHKTQTHQIRPIRIGGATRFVNDVLGFAFRLLRH